MASNIKTNKKTNKQTKTHNIPGIWSIKKTTIQRKKGCSGVGGGLGGELFAILKLGRGN